MASESTATAPHEARGTPSPAKKRSFSDPAQAVLAPSPSFRTRIQSLDDHAIPPTTPRPPRRPDFTRGLSLHMPTTTTLGMPSPAHFPRPAGVALSPQLDQNNIYHNQIQIPPASPATSIPRHSRGLDFSRASTNLHHSTVIVERSPDSSPVITQKGMMIPKRKGSISSMMLDSPFMHGAAWGSLPPERSTVSSSVGSVNMMGSESESTDSDEDASMAGENEDDAIFTTPQVHKLHNPNAPTPFTAPLTPGPIVPIASWGNSQFSPAQTSLMKTIRRTKPLKAGHRIRKSSSSASNSGYSSMASPRAGSPPAMRSIEPGANNGYFAWANVARSRRESLALGTDGLHLSSGNDSGDEASQTAPSTPGVVRRPVTRRGNLLPKTKGFARIKAALAEEAAPVDTEVRRESETIRQVRERDNSVISEFDLVPDRFDPNTAPSSPNMLPAVPEHSQEDFGRDLTRELSNGTKGLGVNFAAHATRNSGGLAYWNRFDPAVRTPPPPNFARQSSGILSDVNMDSPGAESTWRRPRARSSASDASDAFAPASNAPMPTSVINDDVHLNKFKRRREDDFDIATIKRRAVSPGMSSAHNSPVLTHSPTQRDVVGVWGQPPERKDKGPPEQGVLQTVRSNSGGGGVGNLVASGKKLGLQGMVDTNDGLMNMSIE